MTMHAYLIPSDTDLARGAVALAHGMVAVDTAQLAREAAFNARTFVDREGKPLLNDDGSVRRVPVTSASAQAWGWIRSLLKRSECEAGRLLRAASDGNAYARLVSRNAGTAARELLEQGRTIGYRMPDGSVVCVGRALATHQEVARIASKPADVNRAMQPYRRALAPAREVKVIDAA